jgi:CRP/FNR family cyclic AMP-dependent transcriptional regulator
MPTISRTRLLDGLWFASEVPLGARRALAAIANVVRVDAGTTLVREGERCDSLGVVVSGRVALRLRSPGGQDRSILTVEPGDVFGWSAVLPQPFATSTAVTVTPTTALLFDGQRLRAAMAIDCELAAAVYGRLLASVARRLVATRLQLLDVYRPGYEPW